MNRYEFLNQLEEQLRGYVDAQEVKDSVQYYQSYIEEEMNKGLTEEEILDELGSANSIAKAIIEARAYQADSDQIYDQPDSDYNGGSSYNGDYNKQSDSPVKVFRANGWLGTAILIAIAFILLMVLGFVFKVIFALIPYMIPIAIIVFVIKMVTGRK